MSETLIWFIAAVVSFVIEILAPLGAFLFVGLGCLAASLASFAGLDSAWQFTAAGVFAVLTALLFRRKLKSIFSGRKATSEELEHQMSGQEGRAKRGRSKYAEASGGPGSKDRHPRPREPASSSFLRPRETPCSFWCAPSSWTEADGRPEKKQCLSNSA